MQNEVAHLLFPSICGLRFGKFPWQDNLRVLKTPRYFWSLRQLEGIGPWSYPTAMEFTDRNARRRSQERVPGGQGPVADGAATLPFSDELDDGPVGEDDVGFVLQGVEVMFGESVTFFSRHEESARFLDERVGRGGSQRFFFIQSLIHGNNELGERMEPGEPRVAHEEFEKMLGGLNRADRLLVTHAVVINKGLVEVHEGMADFGEARSIAGGMDRVGRHFLSCAVLCDRARRNRPFSLPHLHF